MKSLPWKAKVVRIADKLHNVWDLMHHGIPGWSEGKTERYVAWACEMVEALRWALKPWFYHGFTWFYRLNTAILAQFLACWLVSQA